MKTPATMSVMEVVRAGMLVAILLPACDRPVPADDLFASPDGEACVRPPVDSSLDADIVIRGDGPTPCLLRFVPTGTVLRSDSAGTIPDLGQSMVIDSRGRIFTSTSSRGEVAVWNPDGTFLRTLGREGRGPGEFTGTIVLFSDSQDRLHVRDNAGTWTIIDRELNIVGRVPAQVLGGIPGHSAVLDGDVVVNGYPTSADTGYYFLVGDLAGNALRRIVPAPKAPDPDLLGRMVASAGGDSFWAGPSSAGDAGYELHLYRTDGTLLRRIRREVPWYPSPELATRRPEEPPPPAVRLVHVDTAGLLLVYVVVPDERWRMIRDRLERRQKGAELFDARVEVIDSRAGVLLASTIVDDPATLPRAFGRTQLAGQHRESSSGLSEVRVLEYRLVSRR